MGNYKIIKIVQATHHQGDFKYGTSRCIQWSYISLDSVGWPFFRSPGLWDKFDLECILCKRDQLFKFNNMFSTAEIVNSAK